jgi:hypothetical protein
MVGHFLNHLYADTLKADHPRHLMALIEKIDLAERQQMKASQR